MALMRRQSLVKFDAPLCETIVDTPKPKGAEVLIFKHSPLVKAPRILEPPK